MTDGTYEIIRSGAADIGVFSRMCGFASLLVGLSGGADSSLLLHFLCECAKREPHFPALAAIHVNHMIRGSEADRDEEFCRSVCTSLNVPLYVCRADVPALAKSTGTGLEECARSVRYNAFARVRRSLENGTECEGTVLYGTPPQVRGEAVAVTAHNADDNLETVLFDLARGAGTSGLAGIAPVREDGTVRPLLALPSKEIRELCRRENIEFVTDSTNTDEEYTRNYIRKSLVPALMKLNPRAPEAALRASRLLREDEEYIVSQANAALGTYAAGCEAPRSLLASLPAPVLARALRILAANRTDVRMGASHVREAQRLITGTGCGKLSLPGGVVLEVSKSFVRVTDGEKASPLQTREADTPEDGEVVQIKFPEAGFDLFLSRKHGFILPENENIYKLSIHTAFSFDKIKGRIYIRSRMPGDTVEYGGQSHKLKKLFIDKGVPESERAGYPIICDDDGVLCVPGIAWRGKRIPEGRVLDVYYCKYERYTV